MDLIGTRTIREACPDSERAPHSRFLAPLLEVDAAWDVEAVRENYELFRSVEVRAWNLSTIKYRTLFRVRANLDKGLLRELDELDWVARVLAEALPHSCAFRIGEEVFKEGPGREGIGESDRECAGRVGLLIGVSDRMAAER